MTAVPPSPVWGDDRVGAAVYVNGGLVEINLADGWSGRLTPAEAITLMGNLAAAVAQACSWASRWNTDTRTYNDITATADVVPPIGRPAPDPEIRAIVREEIQADRSVRAELREQRRYEVVRESEAALEALKADLQRNGGMEEGRDYLGEILRPALRAALAGYQAEQVPAGRHGVGNVVTQGGEELPAAAGVHESSPSSGCGDSSVGGVRPGGAEETPPPGPGSGAGGAR